MLVACVVVGIAALAVLVRRERHVEAPMLPIRLWRNRIIALGNAGSFGIGATMMGVSVFVPTYVQGVMGRSATAAGIALGAMAIAWAIASIVAGRVMIHTSFRVSAMFGGAMLVAGSGLLAAMTPASGPVWAGAGAALVGVGMGFCNTTYLVSVQAAAALRERGAAIASNMFMRIVGQATGAAVFGALANAGLLYYAPQVQEAAEHLMEPALRRALGPSELATLTSAMASAVGNVYIAAAFLGCAVFGLGTRLPARLNPATSG
jgi:predicted MFS family arabinose efflux permease